VPEQSSAEVDKKINEVNLTPKKVFDDVIASAPPAKKKEAIDTTSKHLHIAERALAKAKAGGEEKVATIALKYELNAKIVMEAPPAMKLERMEELFNAMAAPNHKECLNNVGDKAFCETVSKLQKAFKEVRAAVAQGKEETIDDVFLINQEFAPTIRAINQGFGIRFRKKIRFQPNWTNFGKIQMNFGPNSVKFRNVKHKIRFGPHRNGRISPKFRLIRSNRRTLLSTRRTRMEMRRRSRRFLLPTTSVPMRSLQLRPVKSSE
jgi:hypothetical protein